jgi:hypothetical protein
MVTVYHENGELLFQKDIDHIPIRLIKMYLDEIYSNICAHKHLYNPIHMF